MSLARPAFSARSAFASAANLLYPPAIYCVSCGNLIDDSRPYALCDRCRSEIDWRFGELPSGHEFAKGFYCAVYAGPAKNMVRDMKYHDRPYAAQYIAEAMADRAASEPDIAAADLLIPVPMHAQKKRRRGYNQTELMAARLSGLLGVICAPDILVKVKSTEALSTKNRDERLLALADAFAVRAGDMESQQTERPDSGVRPLSAETGKSSFLRNKSILLIDDVFTTGSTADACTRVLLSAGASAVHLFVFATGAMGIKSS